MTNGTLSEGALPGLLRRLYLARKSGTLALQRESERHALRFHQGQLVHAEGSVQSLCLDALLVERGLLSANELDQARESAQRDGKALARALAEQGRVDRARLDEVRAEQLRAIVRRLAAWSGGTFGFTDGQEQAGDEAAAGAPMGDLILEAVAALRDPQVARFALGDLDRILIHSPDPALRFQKIAIEPSDGYLLSRVDGTLSAREISQMLPHSPEDFVASLYRLYCAGLVEFLDTRSRSSSPGRKAPEPRSPAAPAASRPTAAPAAAPPAPTPPPKPAAAQTAPQAAPAAAPEGKSPLDDARLREVVALHADLGSMSHFDVLGLTRSASETQVKEAYFQLARRYHPDVFRGPTFAEVKDKVEAIFIRLGQAYETLKDAKRRGSYEAMLASREPRPREGAAAAASTPPPSPDPAAEARIAEEAVRRGEKLIAEEKYWDAIQLIEPQLGNARGTVLVRARMVLARAFLKNPNWVKRAEEQLNKVLGDNPRHVEALFLLGDMYQSGGLKRRALAKFRRVAELDSLHEEARARVALLEGDVSPEPEEAEPAASGGFMKRIFGKGD